MKGGITVDLELSAMQQKFCDAYMVDPNATAAAQAAGYKNHKAPDRLMRIPAVRNELARRFRAAQAQAEVTAADIRNGLAAIAFDPRDPGEGGPSVKERRQALNDLARLLGFIVERLQVSTGSVSELDEAELEKIARSNSTNQPRTVQ